VALLMRAMVGRQAREGGVDLPLSRLWAELEQVREVVNVYEARRGQQEPVRQAVLSKLTVMQKRLVEVLRLGAESTPV
jgi:hypothetical protein